MMYSRRKIQAAAMLLVLVMSTIMAVPAGMDLDLCFGKDGHIDFSLDDCPDNPLPKIPHRENSPRYDATHHNECFDVPVVCGAARGPILSGVKPDAESCFQQKASSSTSALFCEWPAETTGIYSDRNTPSSPLEESTSSHIASIRTVILLI